VELPNGIKELAVLDDGSSIIVMHQDLWKEIGNLPLIKNEAVTMECADASLNQTMGLVWNLPVKIGRITFFVQAQVVHNAPYRFLLGRTFSALTGCIKHDDPNGDTMVSLTDPNNPGYTETFPTFARGNKEVTQETFFQSPPGRNSVPQAFDKLVILAEAAIAPYFPLQATGKTTFNEEVFTYKRKYKPVEKKVRAVPATLPEEFRVVRKMPENPLDTLPKISSQPSQVWIPGKRLTVERWAALKDTLKKENFLWPEEIKMLRDVLLANEVALAWDESMRGSFNPEYFPPVILPVVAHEPWAKKSIPIPPGIREQVIEEIKKKIALGVYESSSSSYRSPIFVVPKKDPTKIRIVHDLQELNRVTIRDSGVPPVIDEVIEETAGRVIYTLIDAMVGYDHQSIDPQSRDLTTFQTPLGTFRLTCLPMGWSNSVSVFHGHITFILQEEIPKTARVFIDDIVIKGGKTEHKTKMEIQK
jgi:hypothetical protein